MANLLKADFRRVLKDKLFFVICIIAVVFAFITPLLYLAIFSSLDGEMEEMLDMLGMSVTAKSMFFTAFAFTDNLGLILPILLSVILCKDFSHGTVRNKIIGGYQRRSIFLSMFTVCFTVLFGVLLAHALLTLLISIMFFPFGDGGFGYFMLSLFFEMLVCLFISALVCCFATKGMGAAIGGYIGISMGMSIITSILQIGAMVLDPAMGMGGSDAAFKVVEFIQKINIFNFPAIVGAGTKYSTGEVLACIFSPLIGSMALTALGAHSFEHRDLK